MNPKTPSPYKSDFQDVEKVERRGSATRCASIYKRPYAKALVSWGRDHPAQAPARELRGGGEDQGGAAELDGAGRHRALPVQGDEEPARRSCSSPTPTTSRAGRTISRIVYRVIPSQATIFLEVKAQGVDVAKPHRAAVQAADRVPGVRKAYNKYRYPAPATPTSASTSRIRASPIVGCARRFAHAINKKELLDGVVLGLGREATGPFRPGSWAEQPQRQGHRLRSQAGARRSWPRPAGSATTRGCWPRTASRSPSSC